VVGGLAGGFLLLHTSERTFRGLVPWLILLASALLAAQKPVKAWVQRRLAATGAASPRHHEVAALLPIAMAAVYGGYFGAGLSVIILAVLALALDDTLTRLNALKQALAFATNTAAAVLFVFSGKTLWLVAGVMAVGAVAGGVLGGRLASRVDPETLRFAVVAIGTVVGIVYLVR
jgi:hypothetical protein